MKVFLYLFLFMLVCCDTTTQKKSIIIEDSLYNSMYSSVINLEDVSTKFEDIESISNVDIGTIEYSVSNKMTLGIEQIVSIKIKQDEDEEDIDPIDITNILKFDLKSEAFDIKELPTIEQIINEETYTILKLSLVPTLMGTHNLNLDCTLLDDDKKTIKVFNKFITIKDVPIHKWYYTINSVDKINQDNLSWIELKMSLDSISNEFVLLDKDVEFLLKTPTPDKVNIDNNRVFVPHSKVKNVELRFYFLPSEDAENFILKLYKDDKLFWLRKFQVQKTFNDYLTIVQNYLVYISTIILPLFMLFLRRVKRVLILKKIIMLISSDFDPQDLDVYITEAKDICSARMRLELDDLKNHNTNDYSDYIKWLNNNIYKELYKF